MSDKKLPLTKVQAISMLGDSEYIHTFRSGPMSLLGCDWSRQEIVDAISSNECEVGGEMCKSMNHGLVVHVGGAPLFVECKDGFDYTEFERIINSEKAIKDR